MPIYALDDTLAFPRPELADPSGLLAVGGDLRPERVLLAYAHGIFPWYSEGQPILWHAPDPRFVLELPGALHVGRSLRKTLRKHPYACRADTSFAAVVDACAATPRPDQDGTWITPDLRQAYLDLHALGFAHSIEAFNGEGRLVGGVLGLCIGDVFFGDSMFALAADASKVAFVTLCEQLTRWDIDLVDCQVYTEHLARFGAEEWPRGRYNAALADRVGAPTRRGPWRLDSDLATGVGRPPGGAHRRPHEASR